MSYKVVGALSAICGSYFFSEQLVDGLASFKT